MTPITVARLSYLESVFNGLLARSNPGRVVYYQGIYYIICDEHYSFTLKELQQSKSTMRLMEAAQFAFRLEDKTIILIKNRAAFEEVETRLIISGYTLVADDNKTRVVEDA